MNNPTAAAVTHPDYQTNTTTHLVQTLKTFIFPELHRLMLPQVVTAAEELTGITGEVITYSEDHYRFIDAAYELLAGDPRRWNITGPSGAKWWILPEAP